MLGGLLKSSHLLSLTLLAGLFSLGSGVTPVKASDPSSDCCGDLEERVASLEATTVRKGSRHVSLTLSGFTSRSIMWYDDSSMTGVRSVEPSATSRFRLLGDAKAAPGWTLGYYQEFEYSTAAALAVSQLDDRGFNGATGGNLQGSSPFNFAIRQSHWFIKSDTFGTVSVGRVNTATKDFPTIELGSIVVIAATDSTLAMANFLLRPKETTGREGLSNVRLGAFRTQVSADNLRTDGLRYDSPTLMGFTASAALGDDYLWDVALRYAGDWKDLGLAAGVGYYVDQDEGLCNGTNANTTTAACLTPNTGKPGSREQKIFKSAASTWHKPTGLFLSGAYWTLQYDGIGNIDQVTVNRGAGQRPDSNMWWLAGGIKKDFFGIGNTSFYGEYEKINAPLDGVAVNFSTPSGAGLNFVGGVSSSTMTKWGVGITQGISEARARLYLGYMNYSFDVSGCTAAVVNCASTKQGLQDLQSVQAGAIINF